MSKRNSDHPFLFGVLILLFSGSFGYLAWGELSDKTPHRVSNYYESSKYAVSAQNRVTRTCGVVKDASFSECYIKIEQSERENHRAQKDLRAQRYMAIWASIMAIAAVATVGVTGLGLFWIKGTLDASRDAVKSANLAVEVTRDIGEAQTRAYLTFEDVNLSVTYEADQSTTLEFIGKVTNTGQSPASAVESKYKFHVFDAGESNAKISIGEFDSAGSYGLYIPSRGHCTTSMKSEITASKSQFSSGEKRVCLVYYFDYTDVFQKRISSIPVMVEFKNFAGSEKFEMSYIKGDYVRTE